MLRKIKISNYKMFRDFEMDFTEGINLICGPNGSGKSALRELLSALGNLLALPDVAERVAESVVSSFPAEVFCRWLPQETGYNEIIISLELNGKDEKSGAEELYCYDLTVRYNFLERKSRIQSESLVLHTTNRKHTIVSFANGKLTICTDDGKDLSFSADWNVSGLVTGSRNNSKIIKFGQLMSNVLSVHLNPSLMARDFTAGSQTIGQFGENFAAWNFYNTIRQLNKQLLVFEQCKHFIPGFVTISNPSVGDSYRCKVSVGYNGKTYELALSELSDGQKILFALYSILSNVPDGSTVLIDEPENFLSPGELQPWLNAVNSAWEERDIQFIIISHNPKILNWYHKEAVILKISDKPPRIIAEKNSADPSVSLFDKLREMEWMENGA
ncbi:MAG: AAA family ATPase [Chitinispirillales bacterium]|jgi:predicted ATPase|nr:AAA family ATPase [Chitinispirillales bacterium]